MSQSVTVLGYIDSGKSTLVGHLRYKLDCVTAEEINGAVDYQRVFRYALLCDKNPCSRMRRVTLFNSYNTITSGTRRITLIDTPGHADYVHNLITGLSQGDVALLVVSAASGEFEASISKCYPYGDVVSHIKLARALGVELVIAINKMDQAEVNYRQARFEECKQKVLRIAKKYSYKENIPVVPISAEDGENLVIASEKMAWYTGPSLWEVLLDFPAPPRPVEQSLRVSLHKIIKVGGVGHVGLGKVLSGTLRNGQSVLLSPHEITTEVLSIQILGEEVQEAVAGDLVGVRLANVPPAKKRGSARGIVISDINDVCLPVESFIARILILESVRCLNEGYSPTVDCHTAQFRVVLEDILRKIDTKKGTVLEEKSSVFHVKLTKRDIGEVKMRLLSPVCLESNSKGLGRIIIRDNLRIRAVGTVISTVHQQKEGKFTKAAR